MNLIFKMIFHYFLVSFSLSYNCHFQLTSYASGLILYLPIIAIRVKFRDFLVSGGAVDNQEFISAGNVISSPIAESLMPHSTRKV